MRFFKRLREAEENISQLFTRLAKLTGHTVAILKNISAIIGEIDALKQRISNLEADNVVLHQKLKEIEDKLPEYEDAVAKGADAIWSKALDAVADYNPMVQIKREGAVK